MKVYRIESPYSHPYGLMDIDVPGVRLSRFMCNHDLYAPYSIGNKDIDRSLEHKEYRKGIFFFTEEGWKKVGYRISRILNRKSVPYVTIKAIVPDKERLLYRDRLQVVLKREHIKEVRR